MTLTEQQIKAEVGKLTPLDRELYFEHLEDFKGRRGMTKSQRSIEAANEALERTWRGRRWRAENRIAHPSWPLLEGDEAA